MSAQSGKYRQRWALMILALWLAVVLCGFWWFQWRWYFLVDTQTVWFKGQGWVEASQSPDFIADGGNGPVVVHFYDPACPCSKFNTEHVLALIEEYQGRGVQFEVRVPSADVQAQARQLFGVPVAVAADAQRPAASPSALVLNQAQAAGRTVAYVGPYSAGAVCTGAEDDFVGLVLNRLLNQEKLGWESNLAKGCLCPWPNVESQGA